MLSQVSRSLLSCMVAALGSEVCMDGTATRCALLHNRTYLNGSLEMTFSAANLIDVQNASACDQQALPVGAFDHTRAVVHQQGGLELHSSIKRMTSRPLPSNVACTSLMAREEEGVGIGVGIIVHTRARYGIWIVVVSRMAVHGRWAGGRGFFCGCTYASTHT